MHAQGFLLNCSRQRGFAGLVPICENLVSNRFGYLNPLKEPCEPAKAIYLRQANERRRIAQDEARHLVNFSRSRFASRAVPLTTGIPRDER